MRLVLLLGVALVVALAVALALSRRWQRNASRSSRLLLYAAVVAAVATGLAVLPLLNADDAGAVGTAATVVPPVVLTLLGAAAPRLGRSAAATVVIWTAVVLMFAFVIVYGLGLGFLYAPTAFLLLAGAIARRPAGAPVKRPDR